jgi:hypothetical protein
VKVEESTDDEFERLLRNDLHNGNLKNSKHAIPFKLPSLQKNRFLAVKELVSKHVKIMLLLLSIPSQ